MIYDMDLADSDGDNTETSTEGRSIYYKSSDNDSLG